jgi:hypothetical protein
MGKLGKWEVGRLSDKKIVAECDVKVEWPQAMQEQGITLLNATTADG